jgi:membrane protein YdbS with pleckstrin-like domain
MRSDVDVTIIKPPFERVTGGRVFRPSRAFLHKLWLKSIVAASATWLGVLIGIIFLANFLAYVEPLDYPSAALLVSTWLVRVMTWTTVLELITITRNHVPFRTITNISSQAGPFDRLFGIGSVNIETAGFSGTEAKGPEEKMEGIVFYEEVRDYILTELRKFRAPYVTTTETVRPTGRPPLQGEELNLELLATLREIRDMLREERRAQN